MTPHSMLVDAIVPQHFIFNLVCLCGLWCVHMCAFNCFQRYLNQERPDENEPWNEHSAHRTNFHEIPSRATATTTRRRRDRDARADFVRARFHF